MGVTLFQPYIPPCDPLIPILPPFVMGLPFCFCIPVQGFVQDFMLGGGGVECCH